MKLDSIAPNAHYDMEHGKPAAIQHDNDGSTIIRYNIEPEFTEKEGETEPEQIHAWFLEHVPTLQVVLTLGEKGAYCFTKEETVYQPAYKVKAVDTTAAGDTFTGYFLEALSRDCELAEGMQRAAFASGISVSRQGAAESIPCKTEVDAMLK